MVSPRPADPARGLPICLGYGLYLLNGAPAPTLATLRSDISNGYVNLFELPIRPASPDPRLRWIEANCTQTGASSPLRPIQFATYRCGRLSSKAAVSG